MEHKFPFGIFRPENTGLYLFRCSVAPGNFPLERPCSLYHLLSSGIFRKRFVNDKQPLFQLSHFNSLLGCAFPFPTLPCLTLPYYFSSSPPGLFRKYFYSGTKVFSRERTRGLFLECPGNFSGQESCSGFVVFASKIKVSIILKIIQ